MYKILRKKYFDKKLYKLNDNILDKIEIVLEILEKWPPFEKEYNVHSLNWKYKKYLSINITWDYRIIFNIDKKENIIYLYDIWTHSQLYK